jgi:hypothetical protein
MEDPVQAEKPRDRIREECDTDDRLRDFVYAPLNHESPSIRLIRILDDLSPDGYIQCEVRHASTASTYVCLSYVWGEPEEGEWILLNNQCHWVRENLGNFLQSARQVPNVRQEWLWIDALPINQDNNAERRHQVQQMGQIYSNATRVISWFGMDVEIEHYLNFVASYRLFSRNNGESLLNSVYWTRAWVSESSTQIMKESHVLTGLLLLKITQEFALARTCIFMAGKAYIDHEEITKLNAGRDIAMNGNNNDLDHFLRIQRQQKELKGQSLFSLLTRFHDKQCSDPRDRIFSLLSLCSDGQKFKVDYNIPIRDLLISVLQFCKGSLCFCSVGILHHMLEAGPSPRTIFRQDIAQPPLAHTKSSHITRGADGDFDKRESHKVTASASHPGRKAFCISLEHYELCSHPFAEISFHINSPPSTFFHSAVDEITYSYGARASSHRQPTHACIIYKQSNAYIIFLSFDMFLEMVQEIGDEAQRKFCCYVGNPHNHVRNSLISLYDDKVRIKLHRDVRFIQSTGFSAPSKLISIKP